LATRKRRSSVAPWLDDPFDYGKETTANPFCIGEVLDHFLDARSRAFLVYTHVLLNLLPEGGQDFITAGIVATFISKEAYLQVEQAITLRVRFLARFKFTQGIPETKADVNGNWERDLSIRPRGNREVDRFETFEYRNRQTTGRHTGSLLPGCSDLH
jgi:hypothetical protein